MNSASGGELSVRDARSDELADCLAIRRSVFIEGQSVPEQLEVDGRDAEALHFIARRGRTAIATARLRVLGGDAKAERVAVLSAERGRGLGRLLMQVLEERAHQRGLTRVVLSAQEAVVGFYEQLGYCTEGERFEEAGIPHVKMWKRL